MKNSSFVVAIIAVVIIAAAAIFYVKQNKIIKENNSTIEALETQQNTIDSQVQTISKQKEELEAGYSPAEEAITTVSAKITPAAE